MPETLALLTAREPYPWQVRLTAMLRRGRLPDTVDLPTGSGKSSVMACHLAAWIDAFEAGERPSLARRLVWIVDRRSLVDDASLLASVLSSRVTEILDRLPRLKALLADSDVTSIPVATLRGQRAIDREWTWYPELPAVLVGTVDMMGSRFLMGGYGERWSRATSAGLLGCDAWWYVDEAHLSSPLVTTLRTVAGSRLRDAVSPVPLRVCELTATPAPGVKDVFRLTEEDLDHPVLGPRLKAGKSVKVVTVSERKELVPKIVEAAVKAPGPRVLVAVGSPEEAAKVQALLGKDAKKARSTAQVALLTGTMRGAEREDLTGTDVYRAFMPGSPEPEGRRYLVTTSAGEVGLDLDADSMVCDAVDIDRFVQRLGRVNRTARHELAVVTVVQIETAPDKKKGKGKGKKSGKAAAEVPVRSPGSVAVDLLRRHGFPRFDIVALRQDADFEAARAAPARSVPLQEGDMEMAAFTSLQTAPGRQPPSVFIRGVESGPPTVSVAWRADVTLLIRETARDGETDTGLIREVMDVVPVGRHETCSVPASSAASFVSEVSDRFGEDRRILLRRAGVWNAVKLDANLIMEIKDGEGDLLLLLPSEFGGLSHGVLDKGAVGKPVEDVSGVDVGEGEDRRVIGAEVRMFVTKEPPPVRRDGMRRLLDVVTGHDDEGEPSVWLAVYREDVLSDRPARRQGGRVTSTLAAHDERVGVEARRIARSVGLPDELVEVVGSAGGVHDTGKAAPPWQHAAGNGSPGATPVAKGLGGRFDSSRLRGYRHEFGSLVQGEESGLDDLALHLVASHHGRGRPAFDVEARGPVRQDRALRAIAAQRERFVRLQGRYGIWGVAYLEALLKAADVRVSVSENLE